jgi:hypothetical protein
MEKTAITEIIEEFNKELNVFTQIGNQDKIRITKHLINIASKYLELEKQQIIDAYRVGKVEATLPSEKLTTGGKYYRELFKPE